ncbi:Mu-like prophage major head subunit gpT family protein [Propionivibrio dicarboxylicus]|uniref:Mu-like prophage major head subunit gpT n=1 Tax=Propionivibrio dicarboxylicus TaxID=83767 RepID=A0A1G8LEK2_9RHOO|nr:Mu-like prophage major head subunit gpT family protein [Propionivibrio dicarboxylicus]SDI53660.1 Mu-like prophage major head subunit gpT [Propionivibrio dicarboxylicus]
MIKKFASIGIAIAFAALAVLSWPATAGQDAFTALANSDAVPAFAAVGMLVNASTLQSIFTGLKTLFNNALKAVPGDWQKTAMEVPSTGAGEDYAWLSRFPRMRKWVGDKVVKALKAGKYYKANEDWEATIEVDRNDIEDDRLGLYNNQAMQAGESAGELNDIIVDDLKNNAFTQTGIDGQYFYDTDHPVGDSSVSNKITAALSSATLAGAQASYGALRTKIMEFKDEEGMPLRLIPDTFEVPPALEAAARVICEADKLGDNSPNPYKGTATVLVNPGLTSSTAYMLHVTSKQSVKPFIVQMRKKPVFVSQTGMDNDDVFNRKKFKYGAEARATGLYGYWQLSAASTGAG